MKFKTFLKSLVVIGSLLTANAQATLIGDEIFADGLGLSQSNAVIGAGIEFDFVGFEFFDFASDTLTISHFDNRSHSWGDFGFFTFFGFDTPIVSFELLSNDGYSGDVLTNYSFTEDSITLHWGNGDSVAGAELVFSIGLMQEEVDPIPEPGILALMLLGLAGVARKTARR